MNTKKFKNTIMSIALMVMVIFGSGCAGTYSNAQKGAATGTILGGIAGGIAGNNIDGVGTELGAGAGMLLGAATGYAAGNERDKRNTSGELAAMRHKTLELEYKLEQLKQGRSSSSSTRGVPPGVDARHYQDHMNGVPHTHKEQGITDPNHTHPWMNTGGHRSSSSGSADEGTRKVFKSRDLVSVPTPDGYDIVPINNQTVVYGDIHNHNGPPRRYGTNCGCIGRRHSCGGLAQSGVRFGIGDLRMWNQPN
jgi:hypothetical protein